MGASQLSRLNGYVYLGEQYVHPLRACANIRNNMEANPHAYVRGVATPDKSPRVKFVVLKPSIFFARAEVANAASHTLLSYALCDVTMCFVLPYSHYLQSMLVQYILLDSLLQWTT